MSHATMLDLFKHEMHSDVQIKGKTIWLNRGKEVQGFTLTVPQMRELERSCQEADCKERYLDVPVDVVITKKGDLITFELKVRKIDAHKT